MNDFAVVEAGIRQLHARYADAVWRQDVDSFAECFTEDAIWKIAGKDLCGRATIKAAIASILSNANRILMTFRTPIVEVGDDGAASARTYVTEECSWLNGNANVSIGRYYERFAFDEGRWRFAWRLFELHYSGPPDLSGEFRHHHPDFGPPPAMPPLDYVSVDWPSTNWKKD